jgi:hypothetical protein
MRRLVWITTAATAALAVATSWFALVDDGTRMAEGGTVSAAGELVFCLMLVAFAALGALLATRRPHNPIGWLLVVAGFSLAVSGLARGWYVRAYDAEPGSPLPPDALLWVANWIWVCGFPPLITALLLLFPDGRLPSRRWWPAGALVAAAIAALLVACMLDPGPMDGFPLVENPLGVTANAFELLAAVGYPLFAAGAVASAAGLVTRFRRSHGVERQQLKWMAAAAALAAAAWFANIALDQAFGVNSAFFLPVALLAIPAAATVAILRYRLYDLGLVVNRALVYGALTATLGAAYLSLALLLGLTVGRSDLTVALSTLAVAALFGPARRRIQAAVDKRFYRRRYDAAQTLAAFSAQLRDEVDLDAIGAELRGAAGSALHPAHVSLWLRP